MTIEIREHIPGGDLAPFLRAGREVFAGDPTWVAPLDFEMKERLTPGKNPFFRRGQAALFTAWKHGRVVGRISAQIDREHLRIHQDEAGFFGFFDTIDDPDVAKALVDRAADWLRARGMKAMRGPFSLYINEEVGVLVDGFDTPPAMMMGHSRPYQGALAESAGLAKAKDLFAWKYTTGRMPERAKKAHQTIRSLPEVTFRSVDTSRMRQELDAIMEVFNDAWSDNWGFVPALPDEVEKVAKDMKLVIDPELSFFAEIDRRPVAICVCLPNLNEVVRDFEGKLSPLNIAKLLYRLKVKRPRSARVMMLGIRKEMRNQKKYGALSTALYAEVAFRGERRGIEWGELSWTLEDNKPINLGIRAMGCLHYKTYRVYEKSLA